MIQLHIHDWAALPYGFDLLYTQIDIGPCPLELQSPFINSELVQDSITPPRIMVLLDKPQVYSALSNIRHDFYSLN